jgi:hypothetical protein
MDRLWQTVLSYSQYLAPNRIKIQYFHQHFNINLPIPTQFTIQNGFVNAYFNKLDDLFERNINMKMYFLCVIGILMIDIIKWTFFLFMKRDKEYQISIGDTIPLLGGDESYTKLSVLLFTIYGVLIVQLFHPLSSTPLKKKEFKWIELFKCLRGNLAPKKVNIKEDEGEIVRQGKIPFIQID